jgi:hypothetical protein
MNIELLTKLEDSLEGRMPQGGTFEERHDFLEANGMYQEWRVLFEKYTQLALGDDVEALKRALFFLWYQCSEPTQLSGLDSLDELATEKILRKIEDIIVQNELDKELEFMLPYYYQVCEWYFDRFNELDILLRASRTKNELWQDEAPRSTWKSRGIMGVYWSSKGL